MPNNTEHIKQIALHLNNDNIVLVGLMGCGKSSIGRRLAARLDMPFVDTDKEIEAAAGKSIVDIFAEDGEDVFRDGERRVIARVLHTPRQVVGTGGGAYINPEIRQNIADTSTSVWLRAELDLLMERVARRPDRPLLQADNPRAIMQKLIDERYPIYQSSDIVINSKKAVHDVIVDDVIEKLADYLTTRRKQR